MYRLGHLGLALLLSAPIAFIVGIALTPGFGFLITATAALVSGLPDLDNRPPFQYVFTHRGFTHTVPFGLLLSGVLAVFFANALLAPVAFLAELGVTEPALGQTRTIVTVVLFVGFLTGHVSHLLGDAITIQGIKPFWPLSNRHVNLGALRANSMIWNFVFFLVGAFAQVLALPAATELG